MGGPCIEVGDEEGNYALQEGMAPALFRPRPLSRMTWRKSRSPDPSSGWTASSRWSNEPDLLAEALREIDDNISDTRNGCKGGTSFASWDLTPRLRFAMDVARLARASQARGQEFLRAGPPRGGRYERVGLNDEDCFKFFAALPEQWWQEIHARLEPRKSLLRPGETPARCGTGFIISLSSARSQGLPAVV